ncbi:hypothetical protein GCM10027168_65930 [Streptomyces capparidis]
MTTSAPKRALIPVLAASGALLGSLALAPGAAATPAAGPSAAPAASAAEAPVERLIVGYKDSAPEDDSNSAARKDAAAKGDGTGEELAFKRRLGTGAVLVDLGGKLSDKAADQVVEKFLADPDVAYAVPDLRAKPLAVPTDPRYPEQWDLAGTGAGMNLPGAWDRSTGRGVTVAVIDTGVVPHSDLDANVVAGYDFISDATAARDGGGRDSNPRDQGDWNAAGECNGAPASNSSWHGTHVAGTVAAATNNGRGIAGIAYNAKVQPVRVLGKCGGSFSDIIDAITWSSGGSVAGVPANPTPAKVINMSLGGGGTCNSAIQSAINGAVGRGTAVVVAAGNENRNASSSVPANCSNVITVAATDREGNRAQYSNYGTTVDVAAPGGETAVRANGILSTLNTGTTVPASESYAFYQGTSMAAPHIAGLAALLKSADPAITPARTESLIKSSARALPGTCSGGCGTGLADATATLRALLGS